MAGRSEFRRRRREKKKPNALYFSKDKARERSLDDTIVRQTVTHAVNTLLEMANVNGLCGFAWKARATIGHVGKRRSACAMGNGRID